MKQSSYTIIVTGVGAIIGYGIINSLRKSGEPVEIVGLDIYSDAVGGNWCDHFVQSIPTSDPDYLSFLESNILKYDVDLVIPGIEQDVTFISTEQNRLKHLPARFALNNPGLISISDDKWIFHQHLLKTGLPIINSYIDGTFDEIAEETGEPMLLKPRRSYASKGITRIESEDDFTYWKNKLKDNFMVQEVVGTYQDEFTVGTFGYGDGKCSKKIAFRRTLSGEGATAKAEVIDDPELFSRIDYLVELFKPTGPTNFQFRLHKREYLLLEVNPRISASTSLRTAFGFNEAHMCIQYYLEGGRPDVATVQKGRAIRYIEDFIVYDSDHI